MLAIFQKSLTTAQEFQNLVLIGPIIAPISQVHTAAISELLALRNKT
jgi:hypothetical protein